MKKIKRLATDNIMSLRRGVTCRMSSHATPLFGQSSFTWFFPPLNVHLKIDFLRSRLHQGSDCDCVPEKAHRHTLSLFICPITKVCLTFDPCRQMKLKEEAKELNIFGKVFFCQHCENNCSNLLIYFSSPEPKVVNCFLGLL